MPPESGDRYTIRIGGDATAPVVVGHDNHVEVTNPQPGAGTEEPPAVPASGAGDSTMNNTASGHSTVYAAMHGDIHVHQDAPRDQPHG
ncbi:hypothetical protein ACFU7Y_11635 [Kitasatospora sp. NPDC057542]|uniref:hypothetical protein n=1 Tax=Kitasatospora sp. NPDC057542 TaxID=3346162 RepID=UPI0036B80188